MATGSCEGINEVRREGILKRPLGGFAPRAQAKLVRSGLDSFPFEFSWQRFREDSRRPGPPKATEKCPIRFKTRHFLPFVASDGARRITAGKEIGRPSRAPCWAGFIACTSRDDDGALAFCCLGRPLQLQVVVPALTRT